LDGKPGEGAKNVDNVLRGKVADCREEIRGNNENFDNLFGSRGGRRISMDKEGMRAAEAFSKSNRLG
jgi:hypothetical protein